ncbi:membrane transport protein-domain-containing protein [Pisolithus marmoratus]|nr:membrane transport protein-domain-containing protein [Pisolithus marmoratus]
MHIADTPVLPLLLTVFQSIFQVFLLCLTGYYLAWKGIADKRIQRALNNINIFLFTPALLFSKVAYFLTLEKLRELWVIPLFFLLISGLSGLVANAFARICHLKRSQRNFAIAASMFMNSNSLPVALMQSLVATVPGLKWTPDDDQDAMFGRALTYLVVFSTLGMMLRWSYGIRLLSHANMEEPELIGEVVPRHPGESDTNKIWLPSATPDLKSRRSSRNSLHARYRPHVSPACSGEGLSGSSPFYSPSESELETDSDETLVTREPRQPSGISNLTYGPSSYNYAVDALSRPSTASISLSQHLRTLIHRLRARRIRIPTPPPPLFASLLALLFTLPPLQAVLKSDVMVPLKGTLDSAGACSVPLTLVVLGGWFWEEDGKEGKDANRGHRSVADGGIKTECTGRRPGVPSGEEDEPEQNEVERELGDNHDSIHSQTRRRQVLLCESVESLAAHDRAQGQAPYGGGGRDCSHVSRSPSLSSLFTVLQDLWKMTPVTGRKRRTGPIHLADDDDDQNRNVDIEAGDHAIWRMRSSTSLKGKQTDLPIDVDDADVNNDTAKRQPIRPVPPPGETATVVVTLLSRMILTPLLVLPLIAFLKIRGEGEGEIKVFDEYVFFSFSLCFLPCPRVLPGSHMWSRVLLVPCSS